MLSSPPRANWRLSRFLPVLLLIASSCGGGSDAPPAGSGGGGGSSALDCSADDSSPSEAAVDSGTDSVGDDAPGDAAAEDALTDAEPADSSDAQSDALDSSEPDADSDVVELDAADDSGDGGVAEGGEDGGDADSGEAEAGSGEAGVPGCETTECSQCHGTSGTLDCAPPKSVTGKLGDTDRGVGAHQVHLSTGPNHPAVPSRPVECTDCHPVPTLATLSEPPHMYGSATIEFSGPVGGIQLAGAAAPSFDSGTAQCSNVYCHRPGVTAGGFNTQPTFNVPGTANCGACHSLPPPAPHPQVAECNHCHAEVIGQGGAWADASKHINGTIDVSGCNACHGDQQSPAPPAGLHGEVDTTSLAVGAHRTHLAADVAAMSVPHMTFECGQCHHLPSSYSDPAHVDGDGVAEVSFPIGDGSIAGTGGMTPTWNRATAKCSVYCHQAAGGATNPTPTWTMSAPGQGNVGCGSCHGLPPTQHYPVAPTSCDRCHGAVVKYNSATSQFDFVAPELHVNGVVDVKSACNGCHGGAADNFVSSAPPGDVGTPQGTDSTDPQVGAHQPHLAQNGSQMGLVSQTRHKVIACSECHSIPTWVGEATHLDSAGSPAELVFGTLATTGMWPAPAIDLSNPQAPTCKNTYCHAGMCDGYKKAPQWNGGAAGAMCGSCHGIPPMETRGSDGVCGGVPGWQHSSGLALTDCAVCHPATMKTTGPTTWEWVNDGICHVNGKVSTATCDN